MTDPRPRPTRRQFVCPDPLWARVIQQAREERTNASQWVREAIERRLEEADNHGVYVPRHPRPGAAP